MPSSPSITWCPVNHSSAAIEPNPRRPITAPKPARQRARRDPAVTTPWRSRVVAVQLPVLAHVALDHADPGEHLLGRRGAAGDHVLDLGADPLERPAEDDGDRDERRREEQDDQQQGGAEGEEDDHRADEPDHRRQEAGDRLGQHRADERHVAREARDELAHATLAVEVERQRHEASVQLAADLGHDALADHAQEPGLDEARDRLDAGRARSASGSAGRAPPDRRPRRPGS